ncbi:APC family permease [Bacillus ndiopicus]|uniref:APC family permease n=1 Tax=Bacillus ndiopicus TaxID=1347368 RepID=UPI0005AA94EC|nr:APC family permease [Bacillus ndiopicus]
MKSSLKRYLIGKPLKSDALGEQKLSKTKALAILSSDALSSVAYGPEQILLVLITVSTVALWYSLPIAVGVIVLLVALILSYRQVIFAYPHGGGAYVVSRENLGVNAGLVAGGSLLVDYILTVAVSVSAGTDAITSAFPSLHSYNVMIAIFFVICLTLLNLRGVTESASILAYPVYLFVVVMLVLIGVGVYNIITGQVPETLHSPVGTPVAGISLFILLKAFASGSSALTGVEAISNAIPNFKDPAPKNAAKTLLAMGVILAALFVGIIILAYFYGIVPNNHATVVSQIAEASVGRNVFYYIVQGTTAMILVLAANTGYSAFPLLAVNLSKDGFIPRIFQIRGDRLGYSNGIVMLGVAAIVLIILFEGATEHLIPLYAVGVFIPFTLAQVGMVRKWLREKSSGWIGKLIINAIGAVISFVVAMMFLVTKLPQVWPVFIFLPMIIVVFHRIKQHYQDVGEQLRLEERELPNIEGNIFIIPVAGMTKVVENSLHYVKSLNVEKIVAFYVAFDQADAKAFEEKWHKWQPNIRLVTYYSPYRSVTQPLMKFIDKVEHQYGKSGYQITVVIPQFLPKRGWHHALHNQSSILIRAALLFHKNVIIMTVPYHLKK